jgi:hypothetical protein
MKRKWVLVGIFAAPILLVVCLAAFVKASGSFTGYGFLRGAELISDQEVEHVFGGKKLSSRYRTYNVRGDFVALADEASKELTKDGWSEFKYPVSFQKSTRAFLKTSAPKPASSGVPFPESRNITLFRGRATSRGLGSMRADSDKWVVVQIFEGMREKSWMDNIVSMLFPPKATKRASSGVQTIAYSASGPIIVHYGGVSTVRAVRAVAPPPKKPKP